MSPTDEMDIAIIGWSCRLAGSSSLEALPGTPDAFANPPSGSDSARDRLDCFDASFFGLSPEQASVTDPERCVLLQLAHEALESAGYDPYQAPERIGIFLRSAEALDDRTGGGDSLSAWVASRLGLSGNAVAVEASGLPLVRMVLRGYQSLQRGETQLAIVGAFSSEIEPAARAGAQGGGVLVLKCSSAAQAAGDTVHAIIRRVIFDDSVAPQTIHPSQPALELATFIEAAATLKHTPAPISRRIDSGGETADVLFEPVANAAPSIGPPGPHLLTLSARTGEALDQSAAALRAFLEHSESPDMGDVAYTLHVGRRAFAHRRIVVCADREDAVSALIGKDSSRVLSSHIEPARRPIVFMIPGVGDQYVGMGHGLYTSWEVFRREVDRCAAILEPLLGADIRRVLYPSNDAWKKVAQSKGIDLKRMLGRSAEETPDADTALLNTTRLAQPALFTVEYALARLWLSLGVAPDAIVGHSMGEYLAACLAGVMSLEDALRLVAVRAKLVNELPQAIMLAVMQTEEDLRPLLSPEVHLSLINGPSHCVIAGPPEAVSAVEQMLTAREIIARRVQNGHAFHTPLMNPVLSLFAAELAEIRFREPQIPYLSNVTGDWITRAQATDRGYWVQHLSQTARFSDGLRRLWQLENPLLIECGPGRTLSVLAAQHPDRKATLKGGIWSMRQRYENELDERVLLGAIGKVWLGGADIAWDRLSRAGRQRRIPLPTYPHERGQYWTAAAALTQATPAESPAPSATGEPIGRLEDDRPANAREMELVRIWQNALGRSDVGVNDSFGSLGGDSLSSIGVVMDMRRLGIPDDVARGLYRGFTIRQLARADRDERNASVVAKIQLSSVDTGVFVRALAILVVVAGHFGLTDWVGNPVLMIISGMSFAKYQLHSIARERHIGPIFSFALRVAIPSVLYTILRQALHGSFQIKSLLLLDNLMDPWPFGDYQSPYFIDLLIQNLVIAGIPLSIGAIRRFAVEKPYAYAMSFLAVSFVANLAIHSIWDPKRTWVFVPHMYMWLLALGWCAACSNTDRLKIITSGALLAMTWFTGFWGTGILQWYMVLAALALIWFDEIPAQLPRGVVTVINGAAAASLFIYLTHNGFKFLLHFIPPWWAVACAMLGGFFVWKGWNFASRTTMRWVRGLGRSRGPDLSSESTDSW